MCSNLALFVSPKSSGIIGITGQKGEKGIKGSEGFEGLTGERGDTGADGLPVSQRITSACECACLALACDTCCFASLLLLAASDLSVVLVTYSTGSTPTAINSEDLAAFHSGK